MSGIRAARAGDEAAVWPLARALATSAVPTREDFGRSFHSILATPEHSSVLVAVDADAVVGYVHVLLHPAFHANGNIAWVEELAVDARRRGEGWGRRLMAAAEAWAVSRGDAAYVALATRRAGGFYAAIGFEESATYFKKSLRRPGGGRCRAPARDTSP